METICMKCQILFYRENEKNIINFSSVELAQRVVKDKFSILLIKLSSNEVLL